MLRKLFKLVKLPSLFVAGLVLLGCSTTFTAGEMLPIDPEPTAEPVNCALILPIEAVRLTGIHLTPTNPEPATSSQPLFISSLHQPLELLTQPLATNLNELAISANHVVETSTPVALEPLLPSITALDAELQWQIYRDVCHENKVRFCALMAMARKESGFDPTKIGDDGQSFGIVQIMVRWHQARLEKFGYTVDDLFDPIKCLTVGLDYLEELAGRPEELEVTHLLLMRYNMGPSGAADAVRRGHQSSYYSREVLPYFEDYLAEFTLPT